MAGLDLVVAGGGLAGLTAGLFGARLGLSTLVLVADIPGGHLATIERVEDFPGFPEGIAGYELGPRVQEQAAAAGADFRMGEAAGLSRAGSGWVVGCAGGDVEARAVIVATGSRARKLGVPGEDRFEGRGLSHCASCDGPLLRGRPAVVVGGGDSAFQEALTLAGYGSEVTLVHEGAPRAQQAYAARVAAEARISTRDGVVEELVGDEALTGVRVSGEVLPAAGVWVYVGMEPNTGWLGDALGLTASGHIPTDVWLRTEIAGVFAAGDVRAESAGQAISAAGDGATAAVAAKRHLEKMARG